MVENWQDYLSFVGYEKVGILRIARPGIKVQYRVQMCPDCGNLFDVFANYTYKQRFEELWPHLFSKDSNTHSLKLYRGRNSIIYLIEKLGRITRSQYLGILNSLFVWPDLRLFSLFSDEQFQ